VICHGGLADLLAVAPLAKAMALSSKLALLVATVSLMSMSSPYFQPAFRTAIALSTVAVDTDCECRAAGRVAAKPKAQSSVPVNIHLSHSEYCQLIDWRTGVDSVVTVPPFE
jgi:hypothetical protein